MLVYYTILFNPLTVITINGTVCLVLYHLVYVHVMSFFSQMYRSPIYTSLVLKGQPLIIQYNTIDLAQEYNTIEDTSCVLPKNFVSVNYQRNYEPLQYH